MLNGIEVSDASMFIETSKIQPGAVLHELAHAYYIRLSDKQRAEIDVAYRQTLESVGYRQVKRHDVSVADAYARSNAAEYSADLTEAYITQRLLSIYPDRTRYL